MDPIEQQLRELLEDNDVKSDVIEEFIATFQKERTDMDIPDASVPELEMKLLETVDWRQRSILAARIISKNLGSGYDY